GMMECKKALVDTAGDFDKAEEMLKEKGLAAMEKRAERETKAGGVFVAASAAGDAVVLAELTCETDFVSRNPDFVAVGQAVAKKALEKGCGAEDAELVGMVADLATKIRENMGLKRVCAVKAAPGELIRTYVHGEAEIGVAVKCKADKPEALSGEEARGFVFSLALHVAAFAPLAVDRSRIAPGYVAEKEALFRAEMAEDEKLKGKPEAQLEGILKGKVNKHLANICLVEQAYVKDEKLSVAQALDEQSKKSGAKIEVAEFAYFKVGE
ncbi:MAG: translation elongation factor Ts, partial [Treponema sp.]|nr:translation elongation factor Ts [Treponema sp.]